MLSVSPHYFRIKSGVQGCHNLPTAYFLRFISNSFLTVFLYSNQIGYFTDVLIQPMFFHSHIFAFVLSLHRISFLSFSRLHALTYSSRPIFKSLSEDLPGTSNSLQLFSYWNSFYYFYATFFTIFS